MGRVNFPELATVAEHLAAIGHVHADRALFYGTERDGCWPLSRTVRITPLDKGWHLLTPLDGSSPIEVRPLQRVWLQG